MFDLQVLLAGVLGIWHCMIMYMNFMYALLLWVGFRHESLSVMTPLIAMYFIQNLIVTVQ